MDGAYVTITIETVRGTEYHCFTARGTKAQIITHCHKKNWIIRNFIELEEEEVYEIDPSLKLKE